MKPVISIISPAIKTKYWPEFYTFFKHNNLPWEIVFVGPRKPGFVLPENFRHIRINLKPMQCMEVAAMEARGEYLVIIPDDVKVHRESLDWAYTFKNHLPPFSVVGFRYKREGSIWERNDQAALLPQVPNSPILPICGMIKRSEWMELGGIDSQFVGSAGDADLYMRAVERGGWAFISPDSIIYERDLRDDASRLAKRFKSDYRFFIDQWVDESVDDEKELIFRKYRRDATIPFDHSTIMDGNQGNIAGWT